MSYILYLSLYLFLFSNYSVDIEDSTIITTNANVGIKRFITSSFVIPEEFYSGRQEDTLFIDDQGISGYFFMPQNGYYAQKFTPGVECTLKSAIVITFDTGDTCYFFVWKDSLGLPGSSLISWLPFIGTFPMEWQRIDFPIPLVVNEDFWAGIRGPCPPYPVLDSIGHYNRLAITLLPPFWELKDITCPELKIRVVGSFAGSRHDVSVRHMWLSDGPLLPNPSNVTVSGSVINNGNSVEKDFDVSINAYDSLWTIIFSDTQHIDSLHHLQEDTISFYWDCSQDGDYIVALQTLLGNDCMKDNDTSFTEAHVLTYPSEFYYDDNSPEVTIGGGTENIFALEFTPPYYPCCIESFKIHMESFGGPVDTFRYIAMIIDDNDSGGSPGTIIAQDTIIGIYEGWNSIDLTPLEITIDSGSFYAGYSPLMSLPNVHLHADMDLPFVYLSWFYLHSTNQWYWLYHFAFDLMIRVFVDYPSSVNQYPNRDMVKTDLWVTPNPILSKSRINFSVSKNGSVEISIYSIDGRKIDTLFNSDAKSGSHHIYWKTEDFPHGVYFIRLRSGDFTSVKKVILIR